VKGEVRRIIYPGTFDPITYGHVDLVGRALQLFDEVVLAIAADSTKKPLFSIEERKALAEKALASFGDKVRITSFNGLLIDFVTKEKSRAILRGLRAISDFEFEFQMALMNRKLNDSIETLFLMPRGAYTYLSSTIIKEIGRLGGELSAFVPANVAQALREKYHVKTP
jgi:pantetheine-phosphate adenylyltransferase